MKEYLDVSAVIDWKNPDIFIKARELGSKSNNEFETIKNCFEFVRDEIHHSIDYKINTLTLKASDVLKYKTGFCYAKSHLLAALLRANSIPSGFCYQRLKSEGHFSLHGLNAVFLREYGWFRIDARGNKEGVDTQFYPPEEHIAFKASLSGEADFQEIWPEPLEIIKDFLSKYANVEESLSHMPDIEILNIKVT
jgi:transglutaminase-like putative cysteine protease